MAAVLMSSSRTLRQFFTEHTAVDVFSPARGSSHCDGISTYAGGIGDKPPRSQPQGHAAMAVYFFFQYVLGAGFGTVVTGIVSDFYAKQAMLAAGAAETSAAFR
ncbi:MAG TPA: hypothetical protein VEN78_24570, partial [Bradyrhizobium sp.]|nr:hypothetical protein [Bradyrhizobium sp.]